MIIKIPDNNAAERNYIIDIIFNEFLETDYKIETSNRDFYEIITSENKSIVIKDGFFEQFQEPLSYLKTCNIPQKICFSENQFTVEADIPVIFGTPDVQIVENKIICGIDIFASSFFMLTRWEEYVIDTKDIHERVSDDLQYAVKHHIHERAVVNEYAEMLRNMLKFTGHVIENKHVYKPFLTHDIDFFARYDTFAKLIKALSGDVLKRKSIKEAFKSLKSYYQIKKGRLKDPYDTFDYLIQQSEKAGIKSIFYFIPSFNCESGANYSINNKKVKQTILKIVKNHHIVGVHVAYRSYKNSELFSKELNRFPGAVEIVESRQHFLRIDNPLTWQMLEDADIKTDSSLGYSNHAGFRAGTCYEYSLFNILHRKKLKLKERPLIVMEQALKKEIKGKPEFFDKIIELKEIVNKYSGNFVVLWHNNNFNVNEWEGYSDIYEQLIKNLK